MRLVATVPEAQELAKVEESTFEVPSVTLDEGTSTVDDVREVLDTIVAVAEAVGTTVAVEDAVWTTVPAPAVALYAEQTDSPALCAWARSERAHAEIRHGATRLPMAAFEGPHWHATSTTLQPAAGMADDKQGTYLSIMSIELVHMRIRLREMSILTAQDGCPASAVF